jgi:hypothetical protein
MNIKKKGKSFILILKIVEKMILEIKVVFRLVYISGTLLLFYTI